MASFRLDRTLLRVSGPEARPFLQNLLTQDVERLASRPLLYAGLLTPQGKLITDMLLWAAPEDAVLIDVATARAEDLQRRLTMYRLRAKVEIDRLDQGVALDLDAPSNGAIPDPRLPGAALGWRRIVETDANLAHGEAAWLSHRVTLGVPDPAVDCAPEEVFALEALFEELDGVGFQKGCFVGQENVSRMKRRATTRRKFCPIAFEGSPAPFGTPVQAGEAELGSVRSGIDGRALALLRLDRAQEALNKGETLQVHGRSVRLDPPNWLLTPAAEVG